MTIFSAFLLSIYISPSATAMLPSAIPATNFIRFCAPSDFMNVNARMTSTLSAADDVAPLISTSAKVEVLLFLSGIGHHVAISSSRPLLFVSPPEPNVPLDGGDAAHDKMATEEQPQKDTAMRAGRARFVDPAGGSHGEAVTKERTELSSRE